MAIRFPTWLIDTLLVGAVALVVWMFSMLAGCQGHINEDGEVFVEFGTTITFGQRLPGKDAQKASAELDLTTWLQNIINLQFVKGLATSTDPDSGQSEDLTGTSSEPP